MSLDASQPPHGSAAFEALESYPWHQDIEFQSGLSSILSAPGAASENEDLVLRARCFYFFRKTNTQVDLASYKAWRARQSSVSHEAPLSSSVPTSTSTPPTPADASSYASSNTTTPSQPDYPASFDDIIELIKTGKPIPGIKDIPNIVLAGQGTQARQNRRLKPWETNGEADKDVVGSVTATHGQHTVE